MKNAVYKYVLAAATVGLALGFSACEKKIDPEADHITGVFRGKDCNSNALNVLARQSDDKTYVAFTMTPTGIKGACFKPIEITGTLSGIDTVNIIPKTYTDKCGNKFTVSGLAKISGHAFGYFLTFVMDINGTKDSVKNCFTGAK